jgi:hypothetical protein
MPGPGNKITKNTKINFWKVQVQTPNSRKRSSNFPNKINFWKVQLQTPNSGIRSPNFPKVVYDIPETFGKFKFRLQNPG